MDRRFGEGLEDVLGNVGSRIEGFEDVLRMFQGCLTEVWIGGGFDAVLMSFIYSLEDVRLRFGGYVEGGLAEVSGRFGGGLYKVWRRLTTPRTPPEHHHNNPITRP